MIRKPIPGFSKYEITTSGRVRNVRTGRWKKLRLHPTGYLLVMLRDGKGKLHTKSVHCLVAETFLGPRPKDMLVCHKDSNRANPKLSNLYYGTPSENMQNAAEYKRNHKSKVYPECDLWWSQNQVAYNDRDFKPIPGFPGYFIDEIGRLFSTLQNKFYQKKPRLVGGYLRYTYLKNKEGRRVSKRAHVLVLETFVDLPLPEQEGRHLDGNKLNCSRKNLAWGTSSENRLDTIEQGKSCKLTDPKNQVPQICKLYATGKHTQQELGEMFNVSHTQISKIVRYENWAWLKQA